jgi:hypothetical protein
MLPFVLPERKCLDQDAGFHHDVKGDVRHLESGSSSRCGVAGSPRHNAAFARIGFYYSSFEICAFIQLKVRQQSRYLVFRKSLIQKTLPFIKRVRSAWRPRLPALGYSTSVDTAG